MKTLSSIHEKINNSKDLDFGDIFNRCIELFKKSWLQGFLLQLFAILLMAPVIIIFYIPLLMTMIANAEQGVNDSVTYNGILAGFSLISILFFFLALVVLSAVVICLQAAFYKMLKKLDHGQRVTTSDFFILLKGTYLSKGLVIALSSVGITVLAALLCYLPLIYVMVPIYFFVPFFGFNSDLRIGEIINASFKLGNKKWLITFGLVIVSSFLSSILGYLACGIGILFTSAFIYHPIYFIYKDVIGFDSHEAVDDIGLIED